MSYNPLAIVAAVGAAAIATAIGVNVVLWQDEAEKSPVPATVTASDKARAASDKTPVESAKDTKPDSEGLPAFDVVRVGPNGDTVIAGRARPGSKVIILDNGEPIGGVVADGRGEWVFVPDKPLSPGSRELSLKMIIPGKEGIVSSDVVVLVVPERDKDIAGRDTEKTPGALALKTPSKGGPDTLMQSPGGALALKVPRKGGPSTLMQSPGGPRPKGLSIETLDYDDSGRLIITGRADAKAWVNVYLDNVFIGQGMANEDGLWRLSPEKTVEPGLYTLRADQVDGSGKVLARISMPFSRAEPITIAQPEPFVIVQPGNSLWRLARRAYGYGTRYTVIFQANKDQIKDPDLIYPGQVFALPATN